jgi:hypothetical protein
VLKLLLAQRFGMEGVAWGRVVAEALFLLLPYLVFLPRVVRGLRGRAAMLSVRPSTLRQAQDSG